MDDLGRNLLSPLKLMSSTSRSPAGESPDGIPPPVRPQRAAGAAAGDRGAGPGPTETDRAGGRAAPAAGDRRRRPAAAGLGQRLLPLPLHAGLLAARSLSAGGAGPAGLARGRHREAGAGGAPGPDRVLGARGLTAAGRAAAVAALADGAGRRAGVERRGAGGGRAARVARVRPRRGAGARADPCLGAGGEGAPAGAAGDVELERREDRARV